MRKHRHIEPLGGKRGGSLLILILALMPAAASADLFETLKKSAREALVDAVSRQVDDGENGQDAVSEETDEAVPERSDATAASNPSDEMEDSQAVVTPSTKPSQESAHEVPLSASAQSSASPGGYVPLGQIPDLLILSRLDPNQFTDEIAIRIAAEQIKADQKHLQHIANLEERLAKESRPNIRARLTTLLAEANKKATYFRAEQVRSGDPNVLARQLKDELRRRMLSVAAKVPLDVVAQGRLENLQWDMAADTLFVRPQDARDPPEYLYQQFWAERSGEAPPNAAFPYFSYPRLVPGSGEIQRFPVDYGYQGPPVWKSRDVPPDGQFPGLPAGSAAFTRHVLLPRLAMTRDLYKKLLGKDAQAQIDRIRNDDQLRAQNVLSWDKDDSPSLRLEGRFTAVATGQFQGNPHVVPLVELHRIQLIGKEGVVLRDYPISQLETAAAFLARRAKHEKERQAADEKWERDRADKSAAEAAQREAEQEKGRQRAAERAKERKAGYDLEVREFVERTCNGKRDPYERDSCFAYRKCAHEGAYTAEECAAAKNKHQKAKDERERARAAAQPSARDEAVRVNSNKYKRAQGGHCSGVAWKRKAPGTGNATPEYKAMAASCKEDRLALGESCSARIKPADYGATVPFETEAYADAVIHCVDAADTKWTLK